MIFSLTKAMELQVQLLIPLCHGVQDNDYKYKKIANYELEPDCSHRKLARLEEITKSRTWGKI